MAQAKMAGGCYWIGDTAVDANGVAIENPPAKAADTERSLQPGATNMTSDERLAVAIAKAIQQPAAVAAQVAAQTPTNDAGSGKKSSKSKES